MKTNQRAPLALAMIMVFTATVLLFPVLVNAGNLEPAGPPGPTMHTLEDIYNIVSGQQGGQCAAAVPKTGQTTPYATGDDGDLQKGVAWPNPRFADNGDGTVTDSLTGLMWTKDANIYGQRNWTDALLVCAACTVGGYNDWRLPNVKELQSLVDYGRSSPALPSGHPFDNVQSFAYWPSTTYVDNPSYAWIVYMNIGLVYHYNLKSDFYYVWPVRGGN